MSIFVSIQCKEFPGRVFPLKGAAYAGRWEYEVSKGDRIFYIPDEQAKTVEVYYAGTHPKKGAPR